LSSTSQINLGIAVDLDHEGLIVPVIHRAEEITSGAWPAGSVTSPIGPATAS